MAQKHFSNVQHAITTSLNSLLTFARTFLSVGYAIIVVVTLGVWFAVLAHLFNYSDGKNSRVATILRDLLSCSTAAAVWILCPLWIFQKNS